jgi:predicted peptidase
MKLARTHCFAHVPGKVRASFASASAKTLVLGSLAVLLASVTSAEPFALPTPVPHGEPVQCTYTFQDAHNASIPYALFVPSGYDPTQPAPLIVLLHGLFSTPWQVIHYAGITQEAEKRGYIVVAPAGYNEVGWYGSRGPGKDFVPWISRRRDLPDDLGALSEEDVLNVLALVRKSYSIDSKRIYLMGHSMGGGGTLYLGMKYPELWAALAALAPATYGNPAGLEAIQNMPIMIVQGTRDHLVPVENTRRWVAAMRVLKIDCLYDEIRDGDHIFSICLNPVMIGQVFDFFDHHTK